MSTIDWYAKTYADRYGWHLVPLKEREKLPALNDWGNNTISDPSAAGEYWAKNPRMNMGLELGLSKMCSLDIDCEESFKLLLADFGFDYSDLDNYPTIKGSDKGKRVMFRAPDNIKYAKLNWPSQSDPDGKMHRQMMQDAKQAKDEGDLELEAEIRLKAKDYSKYTVFELRTSDTQQRQDVLPPSYHAGAGRNYEWMVKPPRTLEEWPTPPDWLLAVWQNWDALIEQFKDSCSWLPEPEIEKRATRKPAPSYGNNEKANEVVDTFNRQYNLEHMLENYGYVRKGKRYLSPHSSTGLAGVHILSGGDKCWIFHASDPLCSEEKGQPVSAYDLFCEYEYMGDKSKAFKGAAEQLGIQLSRQPVKHHQEYVTPDTAHKEEDHHEMMIDFDPFIFLDSASKKEAATLPAEAQAYSADFVTPLPWATSKGKPINHHENLHEICKRLGVVLRYNVIRKEEEIIIPRKGFSMDNAANASLAWLMSQCSVFDYPTSKVGDFVTLLADSNPYNPVVEWVSSKPWDGVSRLTDFYGTVTVSGCNELKETLIKRWMISAIIGAYSPFGVSAQGVLVMQGDQGIGKTSWFKSLVPDNLGLLKDGLLLRPEDKDSVKQACSHWLVELGELDATFRKSDIAALKSFITNNKDILRQPFSRKASEFARRTVFFGSVNPREFLHDSTGNRRYWTLEVTDLNSKHGIDMQQVWAEFHTMWKSGEVHYLLPDEEAKLNASNEDFQTVDPIEERIKKSFNWDAPESKWEWMTATEIVMGAGFDRPTKADTNTASAVVRALNDGKVKRNAKGRLMLCAPRVTPF